MWCGLSKLRIYYKIYERAECFLKIGILLFASRGRTINLNLE